MAVPVRMELLAWAAEQGARLTRATRLRQDQRAQRLADLSRALGRPEALLDPARQRFDNWSDRLGPALLAAATRKRAAFNSSAARMQPALLTGYIGRERRLLADRAARLSPALTRLARDSSQDCLRRRGEIGQLAARQAAAMRQRLDKLSERLASLDRMRLTLGYTETLRRGYAVVRGEGGVLTTRAAAEAAVTFEIEFQDGRLPATSGDAPKPKKPKGDPPPFQGSLF
jgi:exodeoxyribonuclease VII large subunit